MRKPISGFALLAFAAIAAGAQIQTVRIHSAFAPGPLGRWTGGILVVRDHPSGPAIQTFDPRGRREIITLRVPEASEIRLYDAIRQPDGSFAAAGTAYVSSGAAAFVWRISAAGMRQNAIPTAPYVPDAVTVAPDGTLWTAGIQKQTVRLSFENFAEKFDVIRRFTPEGRPAGSWIDYKSVSNWYAHATGLLAAAPDRVIWYPYPKGAAEYYEFSLDGQSLRHYPGALMRQGEEFKGAALCGGDLFVARQTPGTKGDIVKFDRNTRAWRPVSGAPGSWSYLCGCDGVRLVTYSTGGPGYQEFDFWTPE